MKKKIKKKSNAKKFKKFDFDYCMKIPNCKLCKYERSCEQFSKSMVMNDKEVMKCKEI